ncbi:MAG: mechanosensitive ion channel family protein [Paracoccaceae bacterium]
MIRTWASTLLLACLIALVSPASGHAQWVASGGEGATEPVEIPRPLTPDLIDGVMSRLTDTEVRALLREELDRQAAEDAKVMDERANPFEVASTRLDDMLTRIGARAQRWAKALMSLDERRPQVEQRLATAESGLAGMVVAALAMILGGFLAGWLISVLLTKPRRWLAAVSDSPEYIERLVRALGLFVLEVLPIIAFVSVTELVAALSSGALGPLNGWVWIFVSGVSWTWTAMVVVRRLFAPDHPGLRLAASSDQAAARIYGLMRRCAFVGVGGWLLAGLSPTLGFGFPPAMVTVALAGTLVLLSLIWAVLIHAHQITVALEGVLHAEGRGLLRILAAAAPYGMLAYLFGAGTWWLLHWLERGQHRLDGPLGTVCVVLLLPVLDRVGDELTSSALGRQGEWQARFRGVLKGAWRVALGLVATIAVFALWGVDLFILTKGAGAAPWASAIFDIALTLLVGALVWRLVRAALYTEVRVSDAAEDADPSQISAGTRLETLIPLFRNVLLGLLALAIGMIILAAIGVDIGPLIASAGIVGIAIGFGAQTLVRDVFSGVFFLIDDAFRVGEYIELDTDLRGEVEAISVRSLQLRHHRGPVITIPFGELKQITNHNRDWVIYKMPFRMEPETDPQKFKKVVKEVGKEFLAHPDHGPKFIEPLKSQGVYFVDDDSALVFRVKFKCLPRAQFVLRREIYHRLRAVFLENDLTIARRKVEVVSGDTEAGGAASDVVVQPTGGVT